MKTDNDLRRDVELALQWEPSLDERRIGVSVIDGAVTLAGEVTSYAEKWKAQRTVEHVRGVRAIANELRVHDPDERSDTDIARAAVDTLKWTIRVPSDRVKVKVEEGWLTLTGDVNWGFQRHAAERAVRDLKGVKGISNLILVRPKVQPKDVKQEIQRAFERDATLDARDIKVEVSGDEVTLHGEVSSWAERHEAENVAWAAPGVRMVHNDVVVLDERDSS